MKTGQRGTFRDGQQGVIVEVYSNAALFQSDTGARFTILAVEFTPEGAAPAAQRAVFGRKPGSKPIRYRRDARGRDHLVVSGGVS